MNISCNSCGAHYRIQSAKIKADVSRATCRKCGAIILLRKGIERTAAPSDMEDEGFVNHGDERTVITEVPELKEFQATPVLDANAAHAMPVKVARGQSADGIAPQTVNPASHSGEVLANRLEAQLFAQQSGTEPMLTVEAGDAVSEKQDKGRKSVPLPAGARMVASMKSPSDMAKSPTESTKAQPAVVSKAEVPAAPVDMISAQELSSMPSAVSLLGVQPSIDPMPREVRQAMAARGKKSQTAATSMHMGLTAQYESMVQNGLPPGFASARSTHEVTMAIPAVTSASASVETRKTNSTSKVQKVAPSPMSEPPTRSERGPKIVAGMLSVMAFCSVVMLYFQSP